MSKSMMKRKQKLRVVDVEQPGVIFELEVEGDTVKNWKRLSN
jgi:hypothetical protein